MNWNYKKVFSLFTDEKKQKLLAGSNHGLERECLRVDENANISQTPHPKNIGSALTNPYITTDFSEAQLELITPVFQCEEEASNFLKAVHCFINKNLKDELIWPFSMPAKLPKAKEVPIANYGTSNSGKKKTLYRKGLAARYGSKMQTVSGTHYNFSFSEKFWDFMYKKFAQKNQSRQDFVSESYLHLMRNFLRYGWINTYLFGAAPAIDKSYLEKKPKQLKRYGWRTYYGPYATSLRMSNIGYYSRVQAKLDISYNSLSEYLKDLENALNTKIPEYKGKPGVNENLLQIENEHYSRIRPKRKLGDLRPLTALRDHGIQYVEVRTLEINPYQPTGIAKHQIRFLHILLIYCLFHASPKITREEGKSIRENQNKVAHEGRKPGLKLNEGKKEIPLKDLAKKMLDELMQIAQLMDKNCNNIYYQESLDLQFQKLEDPTLLSSAKLLQEMKDHNENFLEFGLRLAKINKKQLEFCPKTSPCHEPLEKAAKQSLLDQEALEIRDNSLLEGHEDLEISTQMLIKEARKRKVEVEIIDRESNFIRLKKGKKNELIQQATMTSKDPLISYFAMANKYVTKKILAEHNINTPQGEKYATEENAINDYPKFATKEIVVKPTNTNFGIGISFVHPNQKKEYADAVRNAFSFGDSIIVEEFVKGEEYRFLVVGDKVVSAIKREPAHVIADGKSTVEELVDLKNADIRTFKFTEKCKIRKDEAEVITLKDQGLTFKSIPKKGQKVYLRKNSNISTGGDAYEFTEKIHKSYHQIAVAAAKAAQANISGVDMMIPNIKSPATKTNYSIVELNFNPSLYIHGFTLEGTPKNVAGAVLDFLGF